MTPPQEACSGTCAALERPSATTSHTACGRITRCCPACCRETITAGRLTESASERSRGERETRAGGTAATSGGRTHSTNCIHRRGKMPRRAVHCSAGEGGRARASGARRQGELRRAGSGAGARGARRAKTEGSARVASKWGSWSRRRRIRVYRTAARGAAGGGSTKTQTGGGEKGTRSHGSWKQGSAGGGRHGTVHGGRASSPHRRGSIPLAPPLLAATRAACSIASHCCRRRCWSSSRRCSSSSHCCRQRS